MAEGDFIAAFLLDALFGAAVEVVRLLLMIFAIVMLFRPDATQWFASRGKLTDASTSS